MVVGGGAAPPITGIAGAAIGAGASPAGACFALASTIGCAAASSLGCSLTDSFDCLLSLSAGFASDAFLAGSEDTVDLLLSVLLERAGAVTVRVVLGSASGAATGAGAVSAWTTGFGWCLNVFGDTNRRRSAPEPAA